MVQAGSLYNEQINGHKFSFLDTYHLQIPINFDHGQGTQISHLQVNYHTKHAQKCSLQWGYMVAQLVEAVCYEPEGRGFDSQWCQWNFSFT
jgi:hypothetical protein